MSEVYRDSDIWIRPFGGKTRQTGRGSQVSGNIASRNPMLAALGRCEFWRLGSGRPNSPAREEQARQQAESAQRTQRIASRRKRVARDAATMVTRP
jgi:hypothetical protein